MKTNRKVRYLESKATIGYVCACGYWKANTATKAWIFIYKIFPGYNIGQRTAATYNILLVKSTYGGKRPATFFNGETIDHYLVGYHICTHV